MRCISITEYKKITYLVNNCRVNLLSVMVPLIDIEEIKYKLDDKNTHNPYGREEDSNQKHEPEESKFGQEPSEGETIHTQDGQRGEDLKLSEVENEKVQLAENSSSSLADQAGELAKDNADVLEPEIHSGVSPQNEN